MRKKIAVILATLALTAIIALPAFADNAADARAWFEQRFNAKKAAVDQAVKDGRLTPEQGQAWQEHLDAMYQFHEQNGFNCPFGGAGRGPGMGRGGMGFGWGGGFGQNAQQQ